MHLVAKVEMADREGMGADKVAVEAVVGKAGSVELEVKEVMAG